MVLIQAYLFLLLKFLLNLTDFMSSVVSGFFKIQCFGDLTSLSGVKQGEVLTCLGPVQGT